VSEGLEQAPLAELTAEIVSAYVSSNQITPSDLGALIDVVAREHYLLCLVCGKPQKVLKRHLNAAHGLTPAQYRERFELKTDYPMIAPRYAQQRSELAVQSGLGRTTKKPVRRQRKKPTTESSPGEAEQ
jgi:predicted transcriptional regulator